MADYPGAVYSPRTKENKPGIEYDSAKKNIGYAEDVVKLDDEVVAIQTELGTEPKGGFASVKTRLEALVPYLGAEDDVDIGWFDFITTGRFNGMKISAPTYVALTSLTGKVFKYAVPNPNAFTIENALTAGIQLSVTGNVALNQSLLLNSNVSFGKLTINQTADSHGIQINGHDDQDAVNIRAYVTSLGASFLKATGNFNFESVTGALFLKAGANKDIYITLGDAAGVEEIRIRDSNSAIVATIDSNGNIVATGRITSAKLVVTSANHGTIAVGGINYIFINSAAGNPVTIDDFTGGVSGQVLHVVIVDNTENTTLNDRSGSNQEMYLHDLANLVIVGGERGGATLICDGNNWYDVSHAKHV